MMMSIRDTNLQGPRSPDAGITNDQQGLCAQAKRSLSSSGEHSKVHVPIGKLPSTWKLSLQTKLCWDILESMECMCIMLVLGSWPELWVQGW